MARKPTEGYVQLVNSYFMNWKVRRLRETAPTALGVFSMVLSYCGFKLSDGWITYNDLRYVIGASDEEINALCGVEMLVKDETGDNYMVHDYLRHNRSNEQVTKKRSTNSANKTPNDADSVPENAKTSAEVPLLFPDSDDTVQKSAETSAEAPKNDAVSGQTTELQNNRTTEHSSFTPPTPSRPDFDRLLDRVESFYPTNRFDGRVTQVRFDLEAEWPKVIRAAGDADPVSFFEAKCRAYVDATEECYVCRFSRFLAQELYARNWQKQLPPSQSAFVKPPVSRSQQNLDHNRQVVWDLMTPEERDRYRKEHSDAFA
ncbi:hypothetical protein JS541_05175 [Bifidobacterium sp. SO1]|nr:hypothetical protein [Bifidobacterium sp. SO1]